MHAPETIRRINREWETRERELRARRISRRIESRHLDAQLHKGRSFNPLAFSRPISPRDLD